MQERNLLWLDLEMTGLDVTTDHILEVACVITDAELTVLAQGPSLVIHQDELILSRMNNEVRAMHTKSGLISLVQKSKISIDQAQDQLVYFLSQHATNQGLILAGNTVWQDRSFLVRYMPQVMPYLHYRIIDVSGIKELVRRWYPQNSHAQFKKHDNHRAHDDVLASIEELKHYRTYFFIR